MSFIGAVLPALSFFRAQSHNYFRTIPFDMKFKYDIRFKSFKLGQSMSWSCNKFEKLIQFFQKFTFKDFTLGKWEHTLLIRKYLWIFGSICHENLNNTRSQTVGSFYIKILD